MYVGTFSDVAALFLHAATTLLALEKLFIEPRQANRDPRGICRLAPVSSD